MKAPAPTAEHFALADCIIDFMKTRNRGELIEAFDNMTVGGARLMREELASILASGGRPSNWVPR